MVFAEDASTSQLIETFLQFQRSCLLEMNAIDLEHMYKLRGKPWCCYTAAFSHSMQTLTHYNFFRAHTILKEKKIENAVEKESIYRLYTTPKSP